MLRDGTKIKEFLAKIKNSVLLLIKQSPLQQCDQWFSLCVIYLSNSRMSVVLTSDMLPMGQQTITLALWTVGLIIRHCLYPRHAPGLK